MKMGAMSKKERNPNLSPTQVCEVPHEMCMGWKQDQEDPSEVLMGSKLKPPTDPGTPPAISRSKSQAMWQELMHPLVYLRRCGLDIYTNSTNICSFIRQDKS